MPSTQDYHVNPHFQMGDSREKEKDTGAQQQGPVARATPRMMGRGGSKSGSQGLMPAANIRNEEEKESESDQRENGAEMSEIHGVNRPFHRKSLGDWDFLETVGAGSMGKVKLAKHRYTNEVCAIKIVNRAAKSFMHKQNQLPPPRTEEELLERKKKLEKELSRDRRTVREASLGQILYHPHICRLFEMCTMSNHFYMLFEYVSGGQLLDYIIQHGSLRERHARKFVRGIASALQYLHMNNIVHRDLKIENIMISTSGEIKIIDFGLSNMYDNKKQLHTFCGSLYFAAPELLKAHPYIGPEVDIWSFGVVIYVLVCGKVPFDDENASVLHEKIKKGKVEYPQHLSIECISLLSKMLVVDPSKRASLRQVCHHQWMQRGYDFPPPSYIPNRVPLTPEMLDINVLKEMYRLELINDVAESLQWLKDIVESREYKQLSREYWYNIQSNSVVEDPTRAFSPLLSTYYLVDEMIKRKLAKKFQKQQMEEQMKSQLQQPTSYGEDIVDTSVPIAVEEFAANTTSRIDTRGNRAGVPQIQEAGVDTTGTPSSYIPSDIQRSNNSNSPLDVAKNLPNIVIPPKISVPPQAHTSPTRKSSDVNQDIDTVMSPSPPATDYPSQQDHSKQHKVKTSGLINNNNITTDKQPKIGSIFRRFSQRHRHVSNTQQAQNMEPKAIPTVSNSIPKNRKTHTRTVSEHVPSSSNAYSDAYFQSGASRDLNADLPALPPNADALVKQQEEKLEDLKITDSGESDKVRYDENKPLPFLSLPKGKKMHPSARAKSVGHARRESLKYDRIPGPLAADEGADIRGTAMPTQVNANNDGFLEHSSGLSAVPIDDVPSLEELTDEEVIERASRAPFGTMPSIDFPRSLFLKGFFSVQTTSSKPLPVVRYKIITTLKKLNIEFKEVKGGFICTHRQSYVPNGKASVQPPAVVINETSSLESEGTGSQSHRRQFSLSSRHGSIRRHGSVKQQQPGIPATPLAANAHERNLSVTSPHTSVGQILEEVSTASFDSLHNNEDMLTNSKAHDMNKTISESNETEAKIDRPPLIFEIHIVKVKLVGLAGVHFKKVSGNTWMYKELASHILKELNL